MHVTEALTGKKLPVEIVPVEEGDLKTFRKDRYFFDWSPEHNHEVYKLRIVGSDDVLGLISLEKIPMNGGCI